MTYPGEDEYLTELAQRNWQQGQREELARHWDLKYECPVCGLVWRDTAPEPGFQRYCPKCEENDE